MAGIYGIGAAVAGGAANIFGSFLNRSWAAEQAETDRRRNYEYGEAAANNADIRQRTLYRDLYSPSAMLNQYMDAGLSPSLLYGNAPTAGGHSAAQGTGAGNIQTPYAPVSMLEAAQIGNLIAQTNKTKAETANVEADTANKGLEYFNLRFDNEVKRIYTRKLQINWEALTNHVITSDGHKESYFNIARNSKSYEDFYNTIKQDISNTNNENAKQEFETEVYQSTLRDIYSTAHKYDQEIQAVELLNENISSKTDINEEQKRLLKWENKLAKAMDNAGFAELNAQAGIKYLRAQIEQSELTEQQKHAWNNLISKLDGSDWKDIIIVLGMILNNAASNWNNPVSFTKKL